MLIRAIKDLVNSRLAGEQLTYTNLLPYLNATIDDINARLHTCYPVFSEISTGDTSIDYNEFPDRYIRTVVCVGAAYKWYIDDEEGIATAEALGQEYQNNLFLMERDFGPLVPADKRRDDKGGFFEDPNYPRPHGNCINPDIRYIPVAGYKGTSISALKIKEVEGSRHLIVTLTDQEFGSKEVDCGIISPNVVAFQLDVKGDIVALMSDNTVYKVGGNLRTLIYSTLLQINPIVHIDYIDYQFVATLLDGSTTVIGELYMPENAQRTFSTVGSENGPTNAREGDIWFQIEEV